ncbi:hypothetical protein H8356DRAFT_1727552 [Neocallimastix lanati (nom. inval.)]|nr:hypothetical protein H8356DRAFT_1727552 [Neocallimastix sp. JGI-2020a]
MDNIVNKYILYFNYTYYLYKLTIIIYFKFNMLIIILYNYIIVFYCFLIVYYLL